jgi:FAD/FMN-containing dehydrogenase
MTIHRESPGGERTAAEVAARLRAELDGRLIEPGHPEYDDARTVYYTGFDRRPSAVVRPTNADEVARVVRSVRGTGVELAVRSGGHSVAGHGVSDGGIVLDLSAMVSLEVDVEGRTAWAGAGLTAGAYTRALGEHGLATGFGDAPSVGVGGITVGGGVGYLHRKLGLTIDSLLAAEVVTADGEVVHADEETRPDLFWAIRGGGGNFGVVTRFHFRLHEVDGVLGGMLLLPATPAVVASFLQEAVHAPDALSGMINVAPAPPLPFIPAEHHGRPILMAALVWAGAPGEGEAVLARLRSLAKPLADAIRPVRYGNIYESGAEPPQAPRGAVHSCFVDDLDVASAETVFEHLERSDARMRVAQFRVLGGAVASVPNGATAFAHRQRAILAAAAALFDHPDDAPRHEAWAADLAGALRQGEPGAYVGFLGDGGASGAREVYPPATWERLRRVKARYDPTNLFRLNLNVPPLSSVEA